MCEFTRNLAFIIGINNYTNGISPLQNAENDAKKLIEILREHHGYQVWVCLNELATLKNLNKLLEETLLEQVSENDRLLFYFAGHGIALNGDDGPAGYLIPQDARLGDTNTYLPMAKLQECLEKLPCRHFLGILDCCFAGAFRWSSTRDLLTAPEVIHKERYDRFITDPAWQVITSAASDQKALDAFDFNTERGQRGNHSPFAAALIEALTGKADIYPPSTNGLPPGDGVITATELYLYLRDAVEPATEKHRQRQTPGIWSLKKHDKGEYIFLSPEHPLNLPSALPLDASKNPYRGLKSFDEEHSELFFGRDELVEKLQNFVKTHPLTLVLGASGSGKSSLVKAGLIPELRKDNTEQWCILSPIRPGETPLQALNNALKDAQLPELIPQNPECNLAWSIDVWANQNPNSKLLLFIDQSEEIITLCQNEDERKQFFREILTAVGAHQRRLRVVLSLRSDFEPQIRDAVLQFVPPILTIENTKLKDRWQSGRFIVPAMTRGELREAIERPAEARVMYFQPHDLVEQIVDEVADMPGALPLLSFALSELYLKYLERQREAQHGGDVIDRALTQEDYQDLGGVIQSLTQRADEEYEALVKKDPAYAQIIRHVMLRMVALGGGELARRQVPSSELEYPPEKNSLVEEVIKHFTNARLLVKGEDAEGHSYVEPAHDALVRGWQRLLSWVEEEKNLRLQRRLTPAALEWKSQKQPRFLWNADSYLDVLKKEVLNSADDWLNQVETEFVQRSVGKKSFNARRNWGIAVSVLIALSSFTAAIWLQLQQTQLRERAARSTNLLATDPLESLVIAINAIGQNRNNPIINRRILPEVQSSLLNAVQTARERNQLTQDAQGRIITTNPDGKHIASTDGNGNVYLWDLQGNLRWKTKGNIRTIQFLEFSPDGKTLIASSNTPNSVFWDLKGNEIQPFGEYGTKITTATFSPDGRFIVGGSHDGTIYWRNLQDNLTVEYRRVSSSAIRAIAYSPDGNIIASAAKDGCVYLWQLQTNKVDKIGCDEDSSQLIFRSMISLTRSIAFSKNSDRIIVNINFTPDELDSESYIGYGSFAILWSLEGDKWNPLQLEVANPGFSSKVSFAAFSPDDSTIATGSEDGSIRLLDREGKEIGQPLLGHSSAVQSVAFSTDGKRIVSNSLDGTIRLWDAEQNLSNQLSFERYGSSSRFGTNVILSPDGQKIAIGGLSDQQGTVTLLDITGNQAGNKIGQISVGTRSGQEREFSAEDYLSGVPLAVSSQGYVVAIDYEKNSLSLWHPGSIRERQSIGNPGTVFEEGIATAISPDSQRIVSTIRGEEGENTYVQLWDIQGNPIGQPVNERGFDVESIAFSRDGQQIVSGHTNFTSQKSFVCLWRLQVKGLEKKICSEIPGNPVEVAFNRDSKTVAIGQQDGGLYLWNLQGNQIGQRFGGNDQPVTSIVFSPDNKTLASGDNDGSVRLWTLEGTPIGRAFQSYTNQRAFQSYAGHRGAVSSIAFDRDGTTMIVAYRDGNVRHWQTNLESWLQVACDRLRDHPILENPDTEEVKGAKETCETYVWTTQISQGWEVSGGSKILPSFEDLGRLPLTGLE